MIHKKYLKTVTVVLLSFFCCCVHSSNISRYQNVNLNAQVSTPDTNHRALFTDTNPPPVSDSKPAADTVDFSAIADSVAPAIIQQQADTDSVTKVNISPVCTPVISIRYPPYRVSRQNVRISLRQKLTKVSFFSVGNMKIDQTDGKCMYFRGRLNAVFHGQNVLSMEAAWGRINVHLPCTLSSQNEYNIIDIDDHSYRGSVILYNDSRNSFSVVNSLPVEEYLRGVLPLEIGRLDPSAMEALKAQAVAARTYTYRRISERLSAPFDMYATTADQVYGGFKDEYHDADLAVRLTKDLVMIYKDSIVQAYYHSTCAGMTANIEDVWKNRGRIEYLRSENDRDENGTPYCAYSKSIKWEEYWTKDQFNKIVTTFLHKAEPSRQFRAPVGDVRILSMLDCGRIRSCLVKGKGWTYECGGDDVRSVFRRPVSGNPILKSANFTVTGNNSGGFKFTGKGYGHGVGMCQTGAIGRARSGQNFEQILQAYYRGITICTALSQM